MTDDKNFPKDKVIFTPLGGVGEFGRNMYVYGYKGKWLIVDFGIGFTKEHPGVDFTLPDPTFMERHREDIVGLVLSHAHFDHVGAIRYLWPRLKCPIYASPFCIAMLEDQLDETGLLGRVPLNKFDKGDTIDLGPFTVSAVHINHSVPETLMLHIKTDKASIVHVTDWKFDESPQLEMKADIDTIKKIGKEGVTALLCDSTNIDVEGYSPSEGKAAANLKTLFKKLAGTRIIVTLFSTNIARMRTIARIGEELGRRTALVGRSLWTADRAARETGYFDGIPEFLTDEEARNYPDGDIIFICTGSQGQARSALMRASFATHRMLKIQRGDAIIFSAREIPGHETAIKNLQTRLSAMGAVIVTNQDTTEDTMVHASGHACREDVRKMYELLKPKIAIPIHGDAEVQIKEHVHLAREECKVPYVFEIGDGEVVQIDEDEPKLLDVTVPIGVLAIDGNRIIELNSDVLHKRKKMISDGTMTITLVVNEGRAILGGVQISSPGVFDGTSKEIKELKEILAGEIASMKEEDFEEDDKLKAILIRVAKKYCKTKSDKKPVMDIHLVRV